MFATVTFFFTILTNHVFGLITFLQRIVHINFSIFPENVCVKFSNTKKFLLYLQRIQTPYKMFSHQKFWENFVLEKKFLKLKMGYKKCEKIF